MRRWEDQFAESAADVARSANGARQVRDTAARYGRRDVVLTAARIAGPCALPVALEAPSQRGAYT
jgi:hypothetical protein